MRTYVRDLISVPRLVLEGCSPISSCGLSRGPWISPADCPIHRRVHDLREAHRARMRTGALISRGGLPLPPTYLSRERERSRPSASASPVPVSRLAGFSDFWRASRCRRGNLTLRHQSETPRRPIRCLVSSGNCRDLHDANLSRSQSADRRPLPPAPLPRGARILNRRKHRSIDRPHLAPDGESNRARPSSTSILYFSNPYPSIHPHGVSSEADSNRQRFSNDGTIGDDLVDARADPLASCQESRVTSHESCATDRCRRA